MFERYPHIGSTAFERFGDGFVFYASSWSKGIAVSAAARNAYIFGPRSDWFEAIVGKNASVPRRPYLPTLKHMLTAAVLGYDPPEPTI